MPGDRVPALLKRDDASICPSCLSSRASLLLDPGISPSRPPLPPRSLVMYVRAYTHARDDEKDRGKGGRRDKMREREREGRERKRGSRAEWKRDGSIYRLLSSDASGITFVRFAGVDDVVAHGVGVISTREGTYLPITVLSPRSFPLARTYARIYWTLRLVPPFPSLVLFIPQSPYVPSASAPRGSASRSSLRSSASTVDAARLLPPP